MPKDAEGVYDTGQTLTEEEKGEILKDVATQKAERKAVADKIKNAKTSAELGITRKAPAAGSTSKPAAASKPAGAKSAAGTKPSAGAKPAKPSGIEGMITAAKKPAAAAAKGSAAKGVGSKLAAAKKGGKASVLSAVLSPEPVLSPEEKAAAEAAEAEAAAAAAAEAHARRLEADAAADAERERRWAESEAQRQEIQNEIVEEERRVRKREEARRKRSSNLHPHPQPHPRPSPAPRTRPRPHLHPHLEQERRKKLAAEKKKQARHTTSHPVLHPLAPRPTPPYNPSYTPLHRGTPSQARLLEAAFDNEQEDVQQMIVAWVEECFSPLIGAKLDCLDANDHTPLSEAACGGAVEVCTLLLKHGANVNTQNHQGRTPLWRAAFMDKQECVRLLLEAGGDPRIPSNDQQTPLQVACILHEIETAPYRAATCCLVTILTCLPSPLHLTRCRWRPTPRSERSSRVGTSRRRRCSSPSYLQPTTYHLPPTTCHLLRQVLIVKNQARLAGQWTPPPPDPADMPIGEPGYSLQIPMQRLSDALDSIMRDSDRYTCCVDLSGKAMTFFTYRDVNLVYAYRPDDVEPQSLRKKVMGALRYGKPLVLDYLSMAIDKEAVVELFDAVLPGLFQLIVTKQILQEENWSRLIREGDDPDYALDMWKPRNLEFFHFILVSKLPKLPEWCTDKFFVLKVAGS